MLKKLPHYTHLLRTFECWLVHMNHGLMYMSIAYQKHDVSLQSGAILKSRGPVCDPLTARGNLQTVLKEHNVVQKENNELRLRAIAFRFLIFSLPLLPLLWT